jgi:hypothetical protein
MILSGDLCRALATMSRLDVEVEIRLCSLADDALGAFTECLHTDRGPITLDRCQITSRVLAAALTGDSRVTRLELPLHWAADDANERDFYRALANNRGLEDLSFYCVSINDENWSILCESLQAHPTLTSLDLRVTSLYSSVGARMEEDQKAHRTRVVAEMMQRDSALHTISLSADERDEQIYTKEIFPRLEMNRYRSRVLAIKKADISLRRPLLGRALQTESIRNDSDLLWMFLWGNADIVVLSNEDGEQVEAVANVPVEVAASEPVAAIEPVEAATPRKRKH